MVNEVIIANEESLEEKKKKILEDGADKFHVLADFDRTLTKAFFNEKKANTIISHLRNGNYLTEGYAKKAHELFDKYHPIEIATDVKDEEKSKKMNEWWNAHFDLLIKSGLNKSDLEKVVNDESLEFREGVVEFLKFLKEKNILLVILSSSGVGDTIPMYLEKEGILYNNIHIISNLYKWDGEENAIGVHEPIIHVMNKSEISVKNLPIYGELLKRKNVLLIGDSLGDLGMIEGFDYDNLVSVGFLNESVEENLERYKKNFDVVITDDGSFDWINKFVGELK